MRKRRIGSAFTFACVRFLGIRRHTLRHTAPLAPAALGPVALGRIAL